MSPVSIGTGIVAILLTFSQQPVYSQSLRSRAVSQTVWLRDSDRQSATGTTSGGPWQLGINKICTTESTFPVRVCLSKGPILGSYAGGGGFLPHSRTVFGSDGIANSRITVTPPPAAGGLFSFAMTTLAVAEKGLFGPNIEAVAIARDPQFVAQPGVFVDTLSLGAGSSIYIDPPGLAEASASFQLTAPNLNNPLASISLVNSSGYVDATVMFASDTHLSFFDPVTKSPITAAQVEASLEGSNTLRTEGGLVSTLPLFTYRYDLTGISLPPDAAFGAEAENIAIAAIPEPTSTLSLLALGTLGAASTLKRKLKSSNPSEKETTKVS